MRKLLLQWLMATFLLHVSSPALLAQCEVQIPTVVGDMDAHYAMDVAVSGNYVFVADALGLRIADISVPSSPQLVGEVDTPDYPQAVAVSGGYAYVADYSSVQVVDVSAPSTPRIIGSVETAGNAYDICIAGSYAYVADDTQGLEVLDISDPSFPSVVGTVNTPGNARGVAVAGGFAYVADGWFGLHIVDISLPTLPAIVGTIKFGVGALKVALSGSHAFVASGSIGLEIVDIAVPSSPRLISSIKTLYSCLDISFIGSYAYVADGSAGLSIIDVSDPSSTKIIGGCKDIINFARGVAVAGPYAFIADGGGGIYSTTGLKILNVSVPFSPYLLSSMSAGELRGICISGSLAYLGSPTFQVVDISSPDRPQIVGTLATSRGWEIVVSGSYAYVAAGSDGLQIIDVSNPTAPFLVGSCDTPGTAYGVDVSGPYAYIADGLAGLQIIDVSSPATPSIVATELISGANNVRILDTLVYISSAGRFTIVDVSAPPFPRILSSLAVPCSDFALAGSYAYLPGSSFNIVDISDPVFPKIVSSLNRACVSVALTECWAFISHGDSNIDIVNIYDPLSPQVINSIYSGPSWDIEVEDGYAYLAAGNRGFQIVDLQSLFQERHPPQELIYDTPIDFLSASYCWMDYYLDIPPSTPTVVRLTPNLPGESIFLFYGRQNELPTFFAFDEMLQTANSGKNYELLLPGTQYGRRLYLSIWNRSTSEASGSIMADGVGKYISANAYTAGNAGESSFIVSGLGFEDSGMRAELRLGDQVLAVGSVELIDSTEILTNFDLTGVAPGTYDLCIIWPGGESMCIQGAFVVTAGVGSVLEASLEAPEVTRMLRQYTLYVKYANVGDSDLVPPLLVIDSPENLRMRISSNDPLESGPIQLLGINLEGYAGVLTPGKSWSIPIKFEAPPWVLRFNFNLSVMDQAGSPINWDAVEAEVCPPDIDPELWERLWPALTSQIGSTWADYQETLAADAGYLSTLGRHMYDVRDIFRFEVHKVLGMNPRAYLAGQLDAYCSTPGLPLAFGRLFSNGMDKRLYQGSFGRGWTHTYDIYLDQLTDGDMLLHESSGFGRPFRRNADGTFSAIAGDYGKLISDGSTFTLTEKDGTIIHFRPDLKLDYIQDLNDNRITASYNESGQLIVVSHSSGKSFQLTYNPQGHIDSLTDHANRITTYAYDASGEHLLTVTAPETRVTKYSYTDPTGQVNDHALLSIEYPNGTHFYYQYDTLGRLSEEYLDGGAERVTYTYDHFGRVTVQDSEGGAVTISPNEYGLPNKTTDALGRSVEMRYGTDFNLSEITDPAWGYYGLNYDHLGNVVNMENPLGHVVSLSYDTRFSSLASLCDGIGNTTSFIYDNNGNLESISYADTSAESFEYDPDGSVTSYTNRRGDSIAYQYNPSGQITRKDYSDGRWVSYGYDPIGRLEEVTDPSGTISLSYDNRDFLTRIEYPNGHWFAFEYNNSGQRTKRTGDDGYILNYHYDAVGRLESLLEGTGTEIIKYQYDSAGRIIRETKGNGTYTTYGYDIAGQLLSLVNYSPEDAVQSRFDYTYDDNGNRTSMTTLEGTTEYEYDALGQLVGVTYPNTNSEQYEYDAAGNRLFMTENGMTSDYNINNMNQYTQVGDATYTYDADGNMASKTDVTGTTTYRWDADNRLISVVTPSDGAWEYSYDALGNRIAITHDGVVTRRYVHDPIGLVDMAAEYDGAGALQARYVHGTGLVASIDGAGNPAYYSFDAIGNTRQVTNAAGTVLNSYSYTPFGSVLQAVETMPAHFKYCGRYGVEDDVNGLRKMGLRFYDPTGGRFVSAEPLRFSPFSTYNYVMNNPLTYGDPAGLARVYIWRGLGNLPHASIQLDHPNHTYISKGPSSFLKVFGCDADFGKNKTLDDDERFLGPPDAIIEISNLDETKIADWFPGYANGARYRLLPDNCVHTVQLALAIGNFDRLNALTPIHLEIALRFEKLLLAIASVVNIGPHDPNEKVGPPGDGTEQRNVAATDTLTYVVYFENEPSATAPAQEVFIEDSLDPNLDLATFHLDEIEFGDHLVSVNEPADHFYTRVTTDTCWVDITSHLNLLSGRVSVALRTLDPETGELPEDPYAGFLPPEDGTGRGQGHVRFTIRPKSTAASGTIITNQASIVFDTNAPVNTNLVSNTIAGLTPAIPSGPLPSDGAVRVSRHTSLNWADSLHATSYDVYFGTTVNPPLYRENLAASFTTLDLLEYGTVYHWKVAARNESGDTTEGPEWTFTTKTEFEAWIDSFAIIPLDERDPGDDPDLDGLTNQEEFDYSTSPDDADTDNDLLIDGDEVHIYWTDPTVPDSDGDGLTDGHEVNDLGTNPNNSDTDADGMPDGWEPQYPNCLNPTVNDADGDCDDDGLTNIQEYHEGTAPDRSDTDGDGFSDFADAFPLDPLEWLDTDGDGIGNNADTDDDSDGYLDTLEEAMGTDPLDGQSVPVASSLTLMPTHVILAVGAMSQMQTTGTFEPVSEDPIEQDVTCAVQYETTAPAIILIGPCGNITGQMEGLTDIRAVQMINGVVAAVSPYSYVTIDGSAPYVDFLDTHPYNGQGMDEDINENGVLDVGEDLDGDGILDVDVGPTPRVPVDTGIVIRVVDNPINGSQSNIGVDSSSIQMLVNDVEVPAHVREVAPGNAHEVDIAYRNSSLFAFDEVVTLELTLTDMAGNPLSHWYSFQIESEAEHQLALEHTPVQAIADLGDGRCEVAVTPLPDVVNDELLDGAKINYQCAEPVAPRVGRVEELPALDIATSVGIPMNLEPANVFDHPVTLTVPLPGVELADTDGNGVPDAGMDDYQIYQYTAHPSVLWRNILDVPGWYVKGSRVNHYETVPPTIELQVNHFSGVHAGYECLTPVADFDMSDTDVCPTEAIAFADTSTGTIDSWLWDFGDGSTSLEQNPAHSFSAVGVYTVCLTVSGPCGSDTICKEITVLSPVTLTCAPDTPTVRRGTKLGYTVTATNNCGTTKTFKYWTNVTLPNGNPYPPSGALFGPVTVTLNAYQTRPVHLTQNIPTAAPLGNYSHNSYAGPSVTNVWDECSFGFQVIP